jgi:predicted DNA-binding transcriptional regulator YafY
MLTMHKEERKKALIQILSNNKLSLSLVSLSEKLECSTKTVRRYIDELVMERSAPWFISNGHVYLDKARQNQIEVDGYWFTSAELFSLLTLSRGFTN